MSQDSEVVKNLKVIVKELDNATDLLEEALPYLEEFQGSSSRLDLLIARVKDAIKQ